MLIVECRRASGSKEPHKMRNKDGDFVVFSVPLW
jgi:hypothetical protein